MNPADSQNSNLSSQPQSPRHKKWLRVLLGLALLLAIVVFVLGKTNVTGNLGAQVYPLPTPGSGIGTGGIGCATQNPWVQIAVPTANQVYVSGQKITVNWSTCGIPASASGLLRITKISGSGPATIGPFVVTGAQTTYTTQPIANLPGIFNGSSSSIMSGIYQATVIYNSMAGTSNNFIVMQTPVGVQMINGGSTGSTTSTGDEILFEIGTIPLRAIGADIYIDKDVAINAAAGTLGSQLITVQEYFWGPNGSNGGQAPFDAQILSGPTLVSLTPGVTLLPGGTYKIPAGTQAQFKISLRLKVPVSITHPYQRWVNVLWDKYAFSLTDSNGNLVETVYQANVGGWGAFNVN